MLIDNAKVTLSISETIYWYVIWNSEKTLALIGKATDVPDWLKGEDGITVLDPDINFVPVTGIVIYFQINLLCSGNFCALELE